jgi:hypothetical protein
VAPHDQVERRVLERQRRRLVNLRDEATERGKVLLGLRAFGGQDSVAASTCGGAGIFAVTSPPPVWMSSAARALAVRSEIRFR